MWTPERKEKEESNCECFLRRTSILWPSSSLYHQSFGRQYADGYAKDSIPENTCCSTKIQPRWVTGCPWILIIYTCIFFIYFILGSWGVVIVVYMMSPGLHPISVTPCRLYANGYPHLHANTYTSIYRWRDALDSLEYAGHSVKFVSVSEFLCRLQCSLKNYKGVFGM